MYSTKPATTNVKIRPGTNPRTEYEYGKDIMAKQMYSENSSAAVYKIVRMGFVSRRSGCKCSCCHEAHSSCSSNKKATAARKSTARMRDNSIANG